MLGKIISIEDNFVLVELENDPTSYGHLINYHVIIKDDYNLVGEIFDVRKNIAYINLLGEMKEELFVFGVIRKPGFGSPVYLISDELVSSILSIPNFREDKHLKIGKSPIYQNVMVSVPINDLFSNHFAIFGSTGSGKSCGVARILQNLFHKKEAIPYKASIILFDAYGEYHNAFSNLNELVPEIHFKAYTTNLEKDEVLHIPLWLLGVDDIALLLGAEKHTQLPIIEKAMKLVTIFGKKEEEVIKSKNDIIARAILDILSSGRQAAQIRDQVVSVLSYYNTKELNLDTPIYQPGYTRPVKQCLMIDQTGKMRDMELVMNFLESFCTEGYELEFPDGSFYYDLDDLRDAFDFALISEGVLKSDKIYDESNVLKVRLHSLVNSPDRAYFDYPRYIDRKSYIRELLTAPDGRKAQIVNFNINYVDDRLAKNITKIYSKLLFDYAKDSNVRGTLPFNIILEEAHRYVQNDDDAFLLGYNIFERITKEGRKYGVLLGLISQRPSELSETVLSQCSNFFIFKMLHPRDVDYIRDMVPNITTDIVKRLRILQPGNCIAFGSAFNLPVLVRLDMPNPAPTSSSCDMSDIWFISKK